MKKFLAIVEFLIGVVLCLVVLADIPKVIAAFVSGNITYGLGACLGAFVFGYLAYWLIKNGRKNWNSPAG